LERLLGRYQFSVDPKGRIKIPARFRKILAPKAGTPTIITRGFDKCLALYPIAEWETVERELRILPYNVAKSRLYTRELASYAVEAELDKQGRVLLSREHREWAGIDSEVLILGVITHLEIFNPEEYERYRSGIGLSYECVAEEVHRLRTGNPSE
jgi:MraZ protein